MILRLHSPEEGYSTLIKKILISSDEVAPRGNHTVERAPLIVDFDDPTKCMIVDDVQQRFLDSEIETVKSGNPPEMKAHPELVERLDLEEDGTFFEQGIRDAISMNWMEWIERFQNDMDTRKNAATFTVPIDDDPPCTMAMQFLVRNEELRLVTFNRSQDMMFAFPMDAGLFGTLMEDMAYVLEVDVGCWVHMMGSAHIYSEQLDEAREIADEA